MRTFIDTGLWKMLLNPTPASIYFAQKDVDAVLNEFVIELIDYCCVEKNLVERTRTLMSAISELAAIRQRFPLHESGKKVSVFTITEQE